MFTGIIIEMGTIELVKRTGGVVRLSVVTPSICKDAVIGDSIAINGVCLTVVDISGNVLSFELSDETLGSTNLGKLNKGEQVNLEPALKADGKLGGHFVTGHVDSIGTILSKKRIGDTIEIEIEAPESVLQYLIDKGSVAVDGISLTVVKVLNKSFKLIIIPHTEAVTNIGTKKAGSSVNLETDIIGKYIKKFLTARNDSSIKEKLIDSGFMSS